jgi:hypothetical protein
LSFAKLILNILCLFDATFSIGDIVVRLVAVLQPYMAFFFSVVVLVWGDELTTAPVSSTESLDETFLGFLHSGGRMFVELRRVDLLCFECLLHEVGARSSPEVGSAHCGCFFFFAWVFG